MVCKVATIFAQIDVTKFATILCFSSVPLLHHMPFTSLCMSCPHINISWVASFASAIASAFDF